MIATAVEHTRETGRIVQRSVVEVREGQVALMIVTTVGLTRVMELIVRPFVPVKTVVRQMLIAKVVEAGGLTSPATTVVTTVEHTRGMGRIVGQPAQVDPLMRARCVWVENVWPARSIILNAFPVLALALPVREIISMVAQH